MLLTTIKELDPKRVIVLDTETTGLRPGKTDEILSLTIINLEGTVLFDELVKPEHRKSWPKAQKVHGISPEMVKDKPHLLDYEERLQQIWKGASLIVGYNVTFDLNFIYASGLRLNRDVPSFDVMKEFAPIWGVWDEYHNDYRWAKLRDCVKYYNLGSFDAHSSLGDAEATRKCFLALINDRKYISMHGKENFGFVLGRLIRKYIIIPAKNAIPAFIRWWFGPDGTKQDALDVVLTIPMVALVLLAILGLFATWEITVACALTIVFLRAMKAHHDKGKVRAK